MPLVTSGVEHGNLRELALARMRDLGLPCKDVRTREAGIRDMCVANPPFFFFRRVFKRPLTHTHTPHTPHIAITVFAPVKWSFAGATTGPTVAGRLFYPTKTLPLIY